MPALMTAPTADRLARVTADWSRIAGEPLTVEEIGGYLYACLKGSITMHWIGTTYGYLNLENVVAVTFGKSKDKPPVEECRITHAGDSDGIDNDLIFKNPNDVNIIRDHLMRLRKE
jgi:hypothetical protein